MRKSGQEGNVLLTALLMLIVMNLLGVGLIRISNSENEAASYKGIDSSVFHYTESCIDEFKATLEVDPLSPATSIDPADLSSLLVSGETLTASGLDDYSYNCTITALGSEAIADGGIGNEIGNVGGEYNSTANLRQKEYFEVESSASGPRNSVRSIEAVVSLQFN